MHKIIFLLGLVFTTCVAYAQYTIQLLDSNTFTLNKGVVLNKISFRGLSVVNDNTIWLSGSKGTIARSTDAGKTFVYTQLKGYEKSDFRDIEAFDDKRAIAMSSGTPAYVIKTTDGGITWKQVYTNNDSLYFLDAMDFWDDKCGIIVGDPIQDHFVFIQTNDAGETWQELDTSNTPKALPGEAVFAASGTSLRCWDKNKFGFVTGGSVSRFFKIEKRYPISNIPLYVWRLVNRHSNYKTKTISIQNTNVTQGKPSKGCFSFDVFKNDVVFVGGDYMIDTLSEKNFSTVDKSTKNKIINVDGLNGYNSCVLIYTAKKINNAKEHFLIATGTKNTEIINYNCPSFIGCCFKDKTIVFNQHFNVVSKAKKGMAVYLAGAKGRIAKLVLN